METQEQVIKKFKHTKATGNDYPKGYKSQINAYMEGFNSGRFNEYKKEFFVESREYANRELERYNEIIKMNWQVAKKMAVNEILEIENEIKKSELLYGKSKITERLDAKRTVLYFICWSLPKIKSEVQE